MVFMGSISYGLYLWHQFFITHIPEWIGWGLCEAPFPQLFLMTMVMSSATVWISLKFLERPLMGQRTRVLAAHREGVTCANEPERVAAIERPARSVGAAGTARLMRCSPERLRSMYDNLPIPIDELKDRAFSLSEAEYGAFYRSLQTHFDQGDTDLTPESLEAVVASTVGDTVLDVACGKGYLGSVLAATTR